MTTNAVTLQVFDSIKAAWNKVGGVKGVFWAGLLCIFVVRVAMLLIRKVIYSPEDTLIDNTALAMVGLLVMFVLWVVAMLLNWGLMYLGMLRSRDESIEFSMIGQVFNWGTALRFVGVFILKMIIFLPFLALIFLPVIVGVVMAAVGMNADAEPSALVLLATGAGGVIAMVVGILIVVFLGIRMFYAELAVVGQKMGPWAAIKHSFCVTKGNFWNLVGLFIMNMIIFTVSCLTLGILFIWTLPYFFINYGMVYSTLSKQAE